MYQDPRLKREVVVKLRFSEHEAALIDALVNFTGEQKATLLRDLVLQQAADVLGVNGAPAYGQNEGDNYHHTAPYRRAG